MKTITTVLSTSALALVGWTASFAAHPNFESLSIKPEWNGPDYIVTYKCPHYKQLNGIHMQDLGDSVAVNYGAFGRRYQEFKCNVPLSTKGAASR